MFGKCPNSDCRETIDEVQADKINIRVDYETA